MSAHLQTHPTDVRPSIPHSGGGERDQAEEASPLAEAEEIPARGDRAGGEGAGDEGATLAPCDDATRGAMIGGLAALPGMDPAIHDFYVQVLARGGCPMGCRPFWPCA